MAYTDSKKPADRAASVAGVIAVHAALGYALIVGLQFTGVIPPPDPPFAGTTVVDPVTLPPPPKPVDDPKPTNTSVVTAPPAPFPINTNSSDMEIKDVLPAPSDYVAPQPGPTFIPGPTPPPKPVADAIAAKARGNPGQWITESDYKTVWINRGLAGSAGFRLTISPDGRVDSCQITRSTGHAALDEATCSLVTRRARFDPARNGAGEKVAGSFASSVLWQIPD